MNPTPRRPPDLVGEVACLLAGGWSIQTALVTCQDGSARLEVLALVSPGGRHAWPFCPRLPRWWCSVEPN